MFLPVRIKRLAFVFFSAAFAISCQANTDDQAAPTTASPRPNTATPVPTPNAQHTQAEPLETSSGDATVVLGYENWDLSMKDAWEGPVASAFENQDPDIEISYLTTSAAEYNEKLLERFAEGTAEDLVACRSFATSAELYDAGYLTSLDEIENGVLPDSAFEAWTASDGVRYCVPITSVMQGFIYNADIFAELELEPPNTLAEFHELLEAIAADGRFVPLAIGLADPWRMGDLGVNIMGPTFWEGEEGRRRLFTGEMDFTDERFVDLFAEIASWRPYLPEEAEFVDGAAATDLFTTGHAAIYPAGSWYVYELVEIDFTVGAFAPPRRDPTEPCYVLDQPDLGIGLNTASPHPDQAKVWLQWLTTAEFSELAAEFFVGRFPMADPAPPSPIPVSAEFDRWRSDCITSMRLSTHLPTSPDFTDRDAWDLIGAVVTGDISAQDASQQLQAGYGPLLEHADP